jgi:hypothetical protein
MADRESSHTSDLRGQSGITRVRFVGLSAACEVALVRAHAGQRREQIVAVLGTNTNTMRPVIHALIADDKITTRGERRGIQHLAA